MIVMETLKNGFYVIKEAKADHTHTSNYQLIQILGKVRVICTRETVSDCIDQYYRGGWDL